MCPTAVIQVGPYAAHFAGFLPTVDRSSAVALALYFTHYLDSAMFSFLPVRKLFGSCDLVGVDLRSKKRRPSVC